MSGCGFYGKLPALGDFVHRRLKRDEIELIDDWLQQCFAYSRESLGEAWLNHYLVSPLWSFVLDQGIVGSDACLGVMIPSVDRVGRYFPFVILQALPEQSNAVRAARLNGVWFEAARDLALKGLDDTNFDMDSFDQEVESLSNLLVLEQGGDTGKDFGSAWRLGFADGYESMSVRLLGQLLKSRLGAFSCWWTEGSDSVASSYLISAGLPQSQAYESMLLGNWESGMWQDWGDVLLDVNTAQSLTQHEQITTEESEPAAVGDDG